MANLRKSLGANWFYPLAVVLIMLAWVISLVSLERLSSGAGPGFEIALLADVFVTLPVLYWLCFRKSHSPAKLVLGIIAVVCSGLWLAGYSVPTAEQRILPQLSWLRYAGLAIVIGFEVRLAALVIRMVWRPQVKMADLAAEGVPPLIAKLMLREVRFWKWVGSAFRK